MLISWERHIKCNFKFNAANPTAVTKLKIPYEFIQPDQEKIPPNVIFDFKNSAIRTITLHIADTDISNMFSSVVRWFMNLIENQMASVSDLYLVGGLWQYPEMQQQIVLCYGAAHNVFVFKDSSEIALKGATKKTLDVEKTNGVDQCLFDDEYYSESDDEESMNGKMADETRDTEILSQQETTSLIESAYVFLFQLEEHSVWAMHEYHDLTPKQVFEIKKTLLEIDAKVVESISKVRHVRHRMPLGSCKF